jgi:hypothetical protein
MRRIKAGLKSDPHASIPWVVAENVFGALGSAALSVGERLKVCVPGLRHPVKIEKV